jgi:hypothetical protein
MPHTALGIDANSTWDAGVRHRRGSLVVEGATARWARQFHLRMRDSGWSAGQRARRPEALTDQRLYV